MSEKCGTCHANQFGASRRWRGRVATRYVQIAFLLPSPVACSYPSACRTCSSEACATSVHFAQPQSHVRLSDALEAFHRKHNVVSVRSDNLLYGKDIVVLFQQVGLSAAYIFCTCMLISHLLI